MLFTLPDCTRATLVAYNVDVGRHVDRIINLNVFRLSLQTVADSVDTVRRQRDAI